MCFAAAVTPVWTPDHRHRALWSRTHTLKCQERKPQPRRPEPETRRITVKSRTTYGVSTVLYISIYFTHRTHAHYAPPRRPAARGRARPRARPRGPPPPPPPARVFCFRVYSRTKIIHTPASAITPVTEGTELPPARYGTADWDKFDIRVTSSLPSK